MGGQNAVSCTLFRNITIALQVPGWPVSEHMRYIDMLDARRFVAMFSAVSNSFIFVENNRCLKNTNEELPNVDSGDRD